MGLRKPNGSGHTPVRSFRVDDDIWERAKDRAAAEGVTISHVLHMIVEGYASGQVDLPETHIVYRPWKGAETHTVHRPPQT